MINEEYKIINLIHKDRKNNLLILKNFKIAKIKNIHAITVCTLKIQQSDIPGDPK